MQNPFARRVRLGSVVRTVLLTQAALSAVSWLVCEARRQGRREGAAEARLEDLRTRLGGERKTTLRVPDAGPQRVRNHG